MKQSLPKGTLAYCCLSLGFTLLSRGFGFYYVKVFLNTYKVKESWFHFSQILYMVWNAINDPLFAHFQDNTSSFLTRTRREGILYTAPLFALSYMVAWLPFGQSDWVVGVHLIIALCFYDTMFTFIGLLSCCLFTEMNADQNDRLRLTRYSTIAGLIGAQNVFVLEYTSDSLQNFRAFQVTSFVIAVMACVLMMYAGLHANTKYDAGNKGVNEDCCKDDESFWRKAWQIMREKDFLAFVTTNFFQVFHKTYLSGFTAIFCDYLIPTSQVSKAARSIFYGMTGTLGGLAVIFGAPLIGRLGYFRVIRYSFIWKFFGGLTIYFIGSSDPWLIMLFIILDSSFASATFSLFNMPLADIADNDKKTYKRKHPISSMVFGTNAVIVKPAQSVAPMIVVAILNHYGYEQLKSGLLPASDVELIKDMMFKMICFFPILLAILQFCAWSQFTIRHKTMEKETEPDHAL